MSDEYRVFAGVIQFDPKHGRQVNGQVVSDITIKSVTSGPDGKQALVGITLWPEFAAIAAVVKKGDFIFGDGKVKVDAGQAADGSPRTFVSISPTTLGHVSGVVKPAQGVVQAAVAVQPVAVAAPVAQPVAAVGTAVVAAPVAAPVPQAVPTAAPAPF